MNRDLHTSPRFEAPAERRNFLGTAEIGVAALGAARLPMPSVFPESNSRVKLGPVERFVATPITVLPDQRVWIYANGEGLFAISAVCSHLGCLVSSNGGEGFFCTAQWHTSHTSLAICFLHVQLLSLAA